MASMKRDAVRKRMAAVPKMVEETVRAARKRDAMTMIAKWRNGIAGNGFRLAPLRPLTIARKRAMGYTKPTVPLYGLGYEGSWTYIKALRAYRTAKGWIVRFSKRKHHSGLTEEELFEIHEYGAVCTGPSGKPFRIPARPAFTKAYQATMAGLRDDSADVTRAIAEAVDKGRSDTARRIQANADKLEAMLGN